MVFGKIINPYYKKYWYLFVIGIVSLAFVDIIQLFIPLIVGQLITSLGSGDIQSFVSLSLIFENGWFVFDLGYVLLSIGLIGLFIGLGRIAWRLSVNQIGKMIECDLRKQMFNHVESLSISWFSKEKVGGLMAYFTNDLEDIRDCFERGMVFLVDTFVLGIGALVFMFLSHWVLALCCLVPVIAMGVSMYLIMKGETRLWNDVSKSFQDLSDLTQESISGLSVVKAFVREGREMKRFSDLNGKSRLSNIQYFKFSQKFGNCWINILIYSTVIVIFLIGGFFVVRNNILIPGISPDKMGTPAQAAGTLTSFLGYFDALIWPLQALTLLIELISRGKAALNRVGRLIDAPIEVKDSPSLRHEGGVKGDIIFKDFSFAYPDKPDTKVLSNISFSLKNGESLGIVGRTGAGKSTLVTSLLKLYNIKRGEIIIDNTDINDWYGRYLRKHIGFVSQDAFLFSDTIKGNIIFGKEDASFDEVRKATSFADVDKNIMDMPEQYETVVGERGKTVSGGQRQRISMARAVLRHPSILVLDDSVSAVDALTEKEILNNIKNQKDQTVFVVSSRLSTVENLDHILVLDQGKMVGFGKHFDLLHTCPTYQKLYQLQQLQKELS